MSEFTPPLTGGLPYRLMQLAQAGEIELVTSPASIAELADELERSHLKPRITAQNLSPVQLLAQYQSFAQHVVPQSAPAVIAADLTMIRSWRALSPATPI